MQKCPFFNLCGGCVYDFTSDTYHAEKLKIISDLPVTESPIWTPAGERRRADFCFSGNKFGFFEKHSKNIVQITKCQNLTANINNILSYLSDLNWGCSGSCLVTDCNNGIDISIMSDVPYFTADFKKSVQNIPAIRITWNGKIIKQSEEPFIMFGDYKVSYPTGAFLQPCVSSEEKIRNLVIKYTNGFNKIADLFCGLGNFTFALKADGFDISGIGIKRDLFKNPISVGMLKQYDCVVMDPPRSGALSQCKEIIKSELKRVIYVSCNPDTFKRDATVLENGGYKLICLIPVDQFVGSRHWEIFSVFDKN